MVTQILHKAKVFDPAAAEAKAQELIENMKPPPDDTFGIHRGFAASGVMK